MRSRSSTSFSIPFAAALAGAAAGCVMGQENPGELPNDPKGDGAGSPIVLDGEASARVDLECETAGGCVFDMGLDLVAPSACELFPEEPDCGAPGAELSRTVGVLHLETPSGKKDESDLVLTSDGGGGYAVEGDVILSYETGSHSIWLEPVEGAPSLELSMDARREPAQPCGHENYDLAGDGTRTLSARAVYGYDERGNDTFVRYDYDLDGTADAVDSWTYDGDFMTREGYDFDGDGAFDTVVEHVQDERGHEVETLRDDDGDGIWDVRERHSYEEGRRVETVTDEGDDGTPDEVTTLVYEEGLHVRDEIDSDLDGTTDGVVTYTRDDAGRPLLVETDKDLDGIAETTTERAYEDGHLVFVHATRDNDDDGTADFFYDSQLEYDELGRKASWINENGDLDEDGAIVEDTLSISENESLFGSCPEIAPVPAEE